MITIILLIIVMGLFCGACAFSGACWAVSHILKYEEPQEGAG